MSANQWRPPTPTCTVGAYDRCGGKFKRIRQDSPDEPDEFECLKCGHTVRGYEVTPTELRLAKCDTCRESFLWKYEHRRVHASSQSAPDRCRACAHLARADSYERSARRHRSQSVEARAQQRRAVARFKPPEAQLIDGGEHG
jgi:hypothetical protein